MAYRGRRVLVTGAGGFIGHHLVRRLAGEGAKVRAFVHYNSENRWGLLEEVPEPFEVFPGDLADPMRVREAVEGCEVVFHLGAQIAIPYSYRARRIFIDANVVGTMNVLEAAKDFRCKRVVATSTSEVYGTAQFTPMHEGHPIHPQSPYAASKVASDALALSYHLSFGMPVVTLRPFNVYGPGQSARSVIPAVIVQALDGDEVRLGLTESVRDFTYVDDTVDAFARAGHAAGVEGQTLNVGTGRGRTVGEIVAAVGKIVGRKLRVKTSKERLRPRASEVTKLVSDASRARKLLGWAPKMRFEVGLLRTVDWVREHVDHFKRRIFNF